MIAADLRACVEWPEGRLDQDCLRTTLDALPAGILPLAAACTRGGLVDESARSISLLRSWHEDGCAHLRIGVFFGEVVAGCNCNDDPVTDNVYACFELRIDPGSAQTGLVAVDG